MADYNAFKRAAIRGQDEIVTCPYNPSHQINKSRLQYHIAKCEKQHALKELEICPFNATHRFARPEMQMHKLECPDRQILERHRFQIEEDSHGKRNLPMFVQPSLPPSEENWDDEDYQSTYDPQQHISNKCVIRAGQGGTKTERRHFREEERRRLNQLSTEKSEPEVSYPERVHPRPPKTLPKGITNSEMGTRLGMGRGLLPSTSTHNVGGSQSFEEASGGNPQ